MNQRRYHVDGVEGNSHRMSERDDYYAFKLKGNLDMRVTDRKYGITQHVVTNAEVKTSSRYTRRLAAIPTLRVLDLFLLLQGQDCLQLSAVWPEHPAPD